MSIRKFVPPVVGALVGAVIVGGVWVGTAAASNHNSVVAKVGNTPITRDQLLAETEAYSGSQMLGQLISNQVVEDGAKQQNISVTTAQVNQALQNLEQQDGISSDSQLNQLLEQSHMTKAELLEQLKVSLLEQKMAESKVKVTDKQIQDYYNKNKKSLATPEEVTLSDIIVKTQAKAQQIESELKQGKKFSDLAKADSTDTSTKSKGGQMGTFSESQLQQADPNVASAAFKLNKGQISAPIKMSEGYMILEATGITPAKTPTLKEATPKITNILKQQNAEPAQQLVADLVKKSNVKILDSSYSSVVDQLENPQTSMPTSASTGGQ